MPLMQLLGKDSRDALVDRLGIAGAPESEQEEILIALSENIVARIVLDCSPRLSPDELTHLRALLEGSDTEALVSFLQGKVTGFDDLVRTAAKEELEATVSGVGA